MVEELEATVQWMTREVDESMDLSFLVGRCAPARQHGVCGATARISCQLLAASFGVSSSPELHQHLVVFFKFSNNSFGRDRLQHCSVHYVHSRYGYRVRSTSPILMPPWTCIKAQQILALSADRMTSRWVKELTPLCSFTWESQYRLQETRLATD